MAPFLQPGIGTALYPNRLFYTFPFPPAAYEHLAVGGWSLSAMPSIVRQAAQIGSAYDEHRRNIMQNRHQGLTTTYTLFHHSTCPEYDIVALRQLHVALDYTIMAWYGWDDLDLHYDVYPNERGHIRRSMFPPSDVGGTPKYRP